MSRTITGSSTIAVRLTLSSDNPVTVDASGRIITNAEYAIYGVSPTTWTIMNLGLVSAEGTQSAGIHLTAGGTVTNGAMDATIAGAQYGIDVEGGSGSVVNNGTIRSTGAVGVGAVPDAIALFGGGTVTNTGGAVISGGYTGVYVAAGAVSNSGSISGAYRGVQAHGGLTIDNLFGGVVQGGRYGIVVTAGVAEVSNDGTIIADNPRTNRPSAVALTGGGIVFNTATGLISGYYRGVYVGGEAGTVINFGSIDGSHHHGALQGSGVDLHGGGTVTNAASGTITGQFAGVWMEYGSENLVNEGAISGIYGVVLNAPGATLINSGTIAGTYGAVQLAGTSDLLVADPGAVFFGTVDAIGGGARLELAIGSGNGGTLLGLGTTILNFGSITFDVGSIWTIAGNTSGLSGVISGFAQGDTIDLMGLHETVHDYSAGTLTLVGDQTVTLYLPGSFTTASFQTASDGGSGTNIFLLPCFATGTLIRTIRGDTPVERLREGDQIKLARAKTTKPVIWIGHRTIDCTRHPKPRLVWPVRIVAHAFGPGLPYRDLLLSPDHAVLIGDILVPIKYLINGSSIIQVAVDTVRYYHIGLPRHDVVLAQGMPVESCLDTGNRLHFVNGGPVIELYPDFASRVWEADGCAPLVVVGPRVDAIQRRLATIAATLQGMSATRGRRRMLAA